MPYRLFIPVLIFLATTMVSCVRVDEVKPASQSAEYHYILGVSSLNEQSPTEALKEFLAAEGYDAKDHRIQAGLAQAYWLKQAHDLAEQHFKKAIKLSDGDPKYHNNIAALYLSMERYDDAINSFQLAADNLLFDRPELAWTGIGLANFHKQDYPAAQRSYQKAMQLNPSYYMPPFRLGELYYNQDRTVEALDMFIRSSHLAPGFTTAHYWQGLTYMKMKNSEKAMLAFQEVVRLAPESETARLSRDYLKIIGK